MRDYRVSQLDADPKFDDARILRTLNDRDYWDFFREARLVLGPATFNGIIANTLDRKGAVSPTLKSLLKLDPKGIVTLNLDKTAGIEFNQVNNDLIVPIDGFEIAKKWNFIKDEKKFLVYMHGHISNPSSWVLGRDQLDALLATKTHERFLSALYSEHTVLFTGVSADDIALSSALVSIREEGIQPKRLFWLTSRADKHTREWANENFVQIITYAATNDDDHSKSTEAFVSAISSYISRDETKIAPHVPSMHKNTLPSLDPDELANKDPEHVRYYISDYMSQILSSTPDDLKYNKFHEIASYYDFPIRSRAFYRNKSSRFDTFFGNRIIFPELGMGNFGTVYQAVDPDGNDLAIKIMHDNILGTQEMIGGFRRGTRSMRILTDNKVEGIAPLLQSYEMPPTIVMKHIPGNSLEDLFSNILSIPWAPKILIIKKVSDIVNNCHSLIENVLHRDLKPSNIMVSGLDYGDYTFESVTVLDFDMSWHKGSSEKDVVFESRDDFGYLAPEQTDSGSSQFTRSTKVDSFGLGMTLYAIFSGKHPIPNVAMTDGWMKQINLAFRSNYPFQYRSIPKRLARLVFDATRPNQDDRLAFKSFRFRISQIHSVLESSSPEIPIDILAEEFLARLANTRDYEWDDVTDRGSVRIAGGVSIQVSADDRNDGIAILVQFVSSGGISYQKIRNFVGTAKTIILELVRLDSWKVKSTSGSSDQFEASLIFVNPRNFDDLESGLEVVIRAVEQLIMISRQ